MKKTKKNLNKKVKEEKIVVPQNVECKGIGFIYLDGVKHSIYLSEFKINAALGEYFPCHDKIYLNKNQSSQQQFFTIVHECLHSIMRKHGIMSILASAEHPYKMEEQLCLLLETPICTNLILNGYNSAFFHRVLQGEFSDDPEGERVITVKNEPTN